MSNASRVDRVSIWDRKSRTNTTHFAKWFDGGQARTVCGVWQIATPHMMGEGPSVTCEKCAEHFIRALGDENGEDLPDEAAP